jgi:hypothetical protein
MPEGAEPRYAAGIYGSSGPVPLNGRGRILNSLNQSRAATCRDFAFGVPEIEGSFARSRKKGRNWLKRSQSAPAFIAHHDDEAESLLSAAAFRTPAAGARGEIVVAGVRKPAH